MKCENNVKGGTEEEQERQSTRFKTKLLAERGHGDWSGMRERVHVRNNGNRGWRWLPSKVSGQSE